MLIDYQGKKGNNPVTTPSSLEGAFLDSRVVEQLEDFIDIGLFEIEECDDNDLVALKDYIPEVTLNECNKVVPM